MEGGADIFLDSFKLLIQDGARGNPSFCVNLKMRDCPIFNFSDIVPIIQALLAICIYALYPMRQCRV